MIRIKQLVPLLLLPALCGWEFLCGNSELPDLTAKASETAPWKAVAFERDCGATTGSSYQVSLLPPSDSLPDGGGNVLVLGWDVTGVPIRSMEWLSDLELKITYSSKAKVFEQKTEVNGVHVIYDEVP